MPNLEKESETSSAPADAGHQLSHDDMAKLVGQRLVSLRQAGLTHLPKGVGEYAFEPVQTPEPQTESGSKATKVAQPETQANDPTVARPGSQVAAVQSSNVVRESSPQFRTDRKPDEKKINVTNPEPAAAPQPSASPIGKPNPPTQPAITADAYGPSLPAAERVTALKVLQEEVARCTRCDELASTRSQTVFGVGNPSTRLVLLGEGPGADEDRLGEPFVGAAGQLLDKIISACTLSRSDVYILNTVKCRPPGNRNPSQSELANCWGYAERQLEIIQPEFICCLGSVAARTLLKTTLSIGKMRRQFHSYRGSRVLVTYHPAYLLRTPSAKKHVWEDMQFLMKEMGIELSK